MVQAREPPARVDDDAHRVEADGGPPGAIGHLGQERGGHRADLTLLGLVQRLPGRAVGGAGAACLDLAEDERRGVADHEVQLAVARAVVACDEREAESLEVREREVLTEAAERVAGVGGHGPRR